MLGRRRARVFMALKELVNYRNARPFTQRAEASHTQGLRAAYSSLGICLRRRGAAARRPQRRAPTSHRQPAARAVRSPNPAAVLPRRRGGRWRAGQGRGRSDPGRRGRRNKDRLSSAAATPPRSATVTKTRGRLPRRAHLHGRPRGGCWIALRTMFSTARYLGSLGPGRNLAAGEDHAAAGLGLERHVGGDPATRWTRSTRSARSSARQPPSPRVATVSAARPPARPVARPRSRSARGRLELLGVLRRGRSRPAGARAGSAAVQRHAGATAGRR
jgi:hypothetical protein